jgi:Bacterial Ig domain
MCVAERLKRSLSVLVPVATLLAALLAPATAANATTSYPKVTVTAPSRGNPVTGLDGVFATGSVDPNGTDAPETLALYLNGTLTDSRACDASAGTKPCTLSLLFDASNLSGAQTLRTDFTTVGGKTVSSSQTITAYSPPPHASLTSPAAGDTLPIGNAIEVDTTGNTDVSQSDNPRTMELLVDGASVDSQHCPSPVTDGNNCPMTFSWDATGLTPGTHTLRARMTTYHDIVALSAVVHVTLTGTPAPTPPVVMLTAPLDGATVSDLVGVTATGSVTAQSGDVPFGMTLLINGQPFGASESCAPPISLTCSGSLIWDTTGFAGPYTVAVRFDTALSEATSAAVTVTVHNPPPTVAITAPVQGGSVTGVAQVTAAGLIDARQQDYPKDMQLLVDGAAYGAAVACPVGPATHSSCTAAFSWDTASLSGSHALQVRFDTTYASVTSAKTSVTVAAVKPQPTPTTVTLSAGGPVRRGAQRVVQGSLTNASTHAAIGGAPVQVVFTPLTGTPLTVIATTDATGRFAATDPLVSGRTSVLATTGPDLGSSSASATLTVTVVIGCHLPSHVLRGAMVKVSCAAPGLAYGSVLALHWTGKNGHGVVYGKVKRGNVTFTVSFAKGWSKLWATTATTHTYVASHSRTYALHAS